MASSAMGPAATAGKGSGNRGKHQLNWPADRWDRVDAAVLEEIATTSVVTKFLKVVHVHGSDKIAPADVVNIPSAPTSLASSPPFDPALNVSETATVMVQQPSIEYYLTPAQNEDEAREEFEMAQGQGASTFFSLSIKAAKFIAQVKDMIVANGRSAFYHPVLTPPNALVQFQDKTVGQDLDLGLLQIQPTTPSSGGLAPLGPNQITLPKSQVVHVYPSPSTPPDSWPFYLDRAADAFGKAVPILNLNGYYGNYFALVHQYVKADLSRSLPTTFMTALEPIEALITAGVYGGILPPFFLPIGSNPSAAGLPTQYSDGTSIEGDVLFTGVVGSLSGDSMDLIRGILDRDADGNPLEVVAKFLSVDSNGNYRFSLSERFAFRLKDRAALVLLLFMDFCPKKLAFTVQPANTEANGGLGTFIVQAQDEDGHLVSSFYNSVSVAIGPNSPNGQLVGANTTVPAVAGRATFEGLSINQPGNGYTLVATSQNNQGQPLASATSAAFTVS